MKKHMIGFALFAMICPAAQAGVAIEMEMTQPKPEAEAPVDRIYVQGDMLRMDPHPGSDDNMSVIFRDDTLSILNHDDRTCQTIDEEGMKQLSAQVDEAMKQMNAALANMPPDQRAMVEKMMKEQMPGGMPGMGEAGPPRRVETGDVETVAGYSCTVHTLYAGEEKIWEVCTAEKGLPDVLPEALGAFDALSRFAGKLQESLRQGLFDRMIDTPFYDMNEIGGFPVRVRTFRRGRIETETTLRSITGKDLDAKLFSVPEGYAVKNLADELKADR